jgi:hypothetical protein
VPEENTMSKRYYVEVSKSTYADSPEEALEIILQALRDGTADPHVAVFEDVEEAPVLER